MAVPQQVLRQHVEPQLSDHPPLHPSAPPTSRGTASTTTSQPVPQVYPPVSAHASLSGHESYLSSMRRIWTEAPPPLKWGLASALIDASFFGWGKIFGFAPISKHGLEQRQNEFQWALIGAMTWSMFSVFFTLQASAEADNWVSRWAPNVFRVVAVLRATLMALALTFLIVEYSAVLAHLLDP